MPANLTEVMTNQFKYLFLLLLLVLALTNLPAQDIPNLQDIDVNELTDDQIQQFIDRLEESGYSEQQLEVLARARGMSSTEISKLRRRIQEVRSGQATDQQDQIGRFRTMPEDLSNRERLDRDRETQFDPFSMIYPLDTLMDEDELEIFGLSFFQNENFTFEPSLNVATPKNYQIGPGDQIVIDVWGASEQSYTLDVSPEGSITIPNIGPVFLNGLSIERAEQRIKGKLKSIYSTLDRSTFAQISLGQIRTIKVNIVGEVQYPGTYTLTSFANPINALYVAGGPNEIGSFREIKLFRNGELIETIDTYDFLIRGTGKNTTLQDQDVLLISPYVNRVAIEGEVKRPAYYEMKEGESLMDLLNYSGGFTGEAFTGTLSLRRNLRNRKTVKTIDYDSLGTFLIYDGDFVSVGKITNRFEGRVRVEGAVNFPGEFEISENMKLSEAISLADGLRGDAFMKRGVILRETEDFSLTTIPFSPEEIISGKLDIDLMKEDLIRIQSIYDISEEFILTIEGEVQQPGEYFYSEDMTVEDIIFLAGGFKESAAKSFVEVARRVKDGKDESIVSEIYNFPISEDLSLSSNSSNFQLQPFDLVVIRKSPTYEEQTVVEIEGEVKFPGKYVLTKRNERISDLLRRAGGLTSFAYADGTTLIRRTEFYIDESDEDATDEAARIRREELSAQFERDTAIDADLEEFKTQESVGIELEKILQNPGSKFDLILKEGDILSISRELQTVRIRGEVLYPATVRYDNIYSFKEFISNAGGFTDQAKKRRSYVIYANGKAKRTKSFLGIKLYPKVYPGAEVIVPSKPVKPPLPPQAWIAIASSTASLALVIQQLVSNL